MSARRSRRLGQGLGLGALLGFAACQQVLGLDQPTVSVSAIGRICECVPLTQQGPTFAGSEMAACERALDEQPDELLLAVAENDCTDCANVTSCYALLTEAGKETDACIDSSDCASWACCEGVLEVKLSIEDGKIVPVLSSTPAEPSCCASCSPCSDAFENLNTETEVTACAEAEAPLSDLLLCLGEEADGSCDCVQNQVGPDCLACLAEKAAEACAPQFQACAEDTGRPIQVPE